MAVWWIPLAVELGRKIGERVRARRRKKMLDNIFKSWKTSLIGVLGACLTMIQNGQSWKSVLSALPMLLLGLLAKDGDVTHSK